MSSDTMTMKAIAFMNMRFTLKIIFVTLTEIRVEIETLNSNVNSSRKYKIFSCRDTGVLKDLDMVIPLSVLVYVCITVVDPGGGAKVVMPPPSTWK